MNNLNEFCLFLTNHYNLGIVRKVVIIVRNETRRTTATIICYTLVEINKDNRLSSVFLLGTQG